MTLTLPHLWIMLQGLREIIMTKVAPLNITGEPGGHAG